MTFRQENGYTYDTDSRVWLHNYEKLLRLIYRLLAESTLGYLSSKDSKMLLAYKRKIDVKRILCKAKALSKILSLRLTSYYLLYSYTLIKTLNRKSHLTLAKQLAIYIQYIQDCIPFLLRVHRAFIMHLQNIMFCKVEI